MTKDTNYKLPAIVPIVLYNGAKEWDAVMRFRDLIDESERFGNYMMDQSIVSKDKAAMIKRLNQITQIKDKLPPEKMEQVIERKAPDGCRSILRLC